MVCYFSATGNTKYVANLIAEELQDDTLDLLPWIKSDKLCKIMSKKPFVLCFPCYVCDLPLFVTDFLKRLVLIGNKCVYVVMTCGHSSGISGETVKHIVEHDNKQYMGVYDVAMANNYITSDMFDLTPDDEIRFRIRDAHFQAKRIALFVTNAKPFFCGKVNFGMKVIVKPVALVYAKFWQSAEPFYATDQCVGCGKCEKLCPVNKIHMQGGKPVWEKSCMHCMSCIGNCPVGAIEYGDVTVHKTKYSIDKYLNKEC